MKPEQPMSVVEFVRDVMPTEITQFRMTTTGDVTFYESWTHRGMPSIFREALSDGGFRNCYQLREDHMVLDEASLVSLVYDKIAGELRGWLFSEESVILANLLGLDVKHDVTVEDLWAAAYKYSANKTHNDHKKTARLAVLMAAHRRAGCSK